MITITPWDINDVSLLKAVSIETFGDTFFPNNASQAVSEYMESAYTEARLTQQLNNPNSFFYGIHVGDALAGYLKLNVGQALSEPMGDHTLEIERIYIRLSHKRQGLGKMLYDFAIHQANVHQKTAVWLGVWEHNYDAQKFYEKMGFKRHSEHVFVMGDEHQTDWILIKDID